MKRAPGSSPDGRKFNWHVRLILGLGALGVAAAPSCMVATPGPGSDADELPPKDLAEVPTAPSPSAPQAPDELGGAIVAPDLLDHAAIAKARYGNDGAWYVDNIPFIDVPDAQIQEIYYYRWGVYKRHLRNIGKNAQVVTEFLPDVDWQGPEGTINSAAGHHIHEGRWLRDRRYVDGDIAWWFRGGGNIRQYSFWAAESLYAYYLANGDAELAKGYLPDAKKNYDAWSDHYDADKGLYWQSPVSDATEFTTAALDVNDGWAGDSFRPTLNSYMYGDAMAIAALSRLAGDTATATDYEGRAGKLKATMQRDLWNTSHNHFVDRFSKRYPDRYYQFASGPEEAGLVPWYFNMPDPQYAVAWANLLDPAKFNSAYGPRTIPPSSPYYMVQHRTPGAQPGECEWNGPSWPFQTSIILTGMANLLNGGAQSVVSKAAYFDLLSKYTREHYRDGHPWLAENLNPDTGKWIADYPNRSEFYNHSSYTDLVITGLLGLRPRADETLQLNPLVPDAWSYFAAENIPYHGHLVSIVYDRDGKHYNRGVSGLNVYVDGALVVTNQPLGNITAKVPAPVTPPESPRLINYAYNTNGIGFPAASASFTASVDRAADAIDGRAWYDAMPHNRWTSYSSGNASDWFAVDFGAARRIGTVKLYLYDDGGGVKAPQRYLVQSWNGSAWVDVVNPSASPPTPVGGTVNTVTFDPVSTSQVRVVFTHQPGSFSGLTELEVLEPSPRGEVYQAEAATVMGAKIYRLGATASGARYVGGIDDAGSGVRFEHVKAPAVGRYEVTIRYANGIGSAATHLLSVNGGAAQPVSYPATSGWGEKNGWSTVTVSVDLQAGDNTLAFTKGDQFAELDRIDVAPAGRLGVYEAEGGKVNNAKIYKLGSTASGGSFVGGIDFADSFVELGHVSAPSSGRYRLTIRYANAMGAPSSHAILVNGGAAAKVTYPPTTGWGNKDGWSAVTVDVSLRAGDNVLRFGKGDSYAELDSVSVAVAP